MADHRKIGRVGFSHICNVEPQHIVITASGCGRPMLEQLEKVGTTLHVATI